MKMTQRIFALLLALVLVVSLCPAMEVRAAGQTTRITLDGYYNYNDAQNLLTEINSLRQAQGLEPLKMEQTLMDAAKQRAVEYFIVPESTRPDGSKPETVLEGVWAEGFLAEQEAMVYTGVDGMLQVLDHSLILSQDAASVGIAFFSQSNGNTAAVVIFHERSCETEALQRGKFPQKGMTVDALPEKLHPKLTYPIMNPSTCEGYVQFYKGMTAGVQLTLLRNGKSAQPIEIQSCDYNLTTTDPKVMAVNNENHTLYFTGEGFATIGLEMAGKTMSFMVIQNRVQVFAMPALSYTIEDNYIVVDCSGFVNHSQSELRLYGYSNRENDGSWTGWRWLGFSATHREYIRDQDDTFTFVMAYYDDALGLMMEVGDRLVVQLGDEPSTAPSMNERDGTDMERLWTPEAADLPVLAEEPEPQQAWQNLTNGLEHYNEAKYYSSQNRYAWAVGEVELPGGTTFGDETGAACPVMVLSDLTFGDLPARVLPEVTVDDLRYGDLICFTNEEWGIVTAVAPDYLAVCRAYYQSADQSGYLFSSRSSMMTPAELETEASFALTRYASDSPGAAALAPDIVPADAVIVAQGTETLNGSYAATWTLTEDGTMYLQGFGQFGGNVGVSEPWEKYKTQIRRLVVGQDIFEISPDDFDGCTNLEEVILGDCVVTICDEAFYDCKALKRVTLGSGLRVIGERAFSGCTGLEELILPEHLKTVERGAFYNCSGIKVLELPGSLTEVGSSAFSGWKAMESLTIPGTMTTIGSNVFTNCGIKTLVLSEGVEQVDYDAFSDCTELTTVELPATLQTVDYYAFNGCDAITDVYYNGTKADWEQVECESWELERWGVNFHYLACQHENATVYNGYEPSCDEPGLRDGLYCNDCGLWIPQEEIPALGHEFGEWYICGDATPCQTAEYQRDCGRCGYSETKSEPAQHQLETVYVEPDCTHSGGLMEICTICGTVGQILEEAPALGHDFQSGRCSRCGIMAESFVDVKPTDYFYEPVSWAVACGITAGTGGGRFSPEDSCTRAQVVTFLWRAMGKPEPMGTENPFSDVAEDAYYYDAVLWAVEVGITAGTGGGKFSPDQPCTRAQVVTFLWRTWEEIMPEYTENPFSDVSESEYFYIPVLWAVEWGITSGTGGGKFSPEDSCTRAQVVTFLYRTMVTE